MNKKLLSIFMSVALLFGTFGMAFATELVTTSVASDFSDMPDNWSTTALNKAVENGLLTGYAEGGKKLIKAGNFLTRAEMAAVVNRVFAAEKMSDLSEVSDVSSSAWYAKDMAKAVQMGTFSYDTKMRPGDNITRQEAFTVLARAFKLVGTDADHEALNAFSDKDEIATWALNSLDGMAAAGYIQGSGGMVKPTANITRAEFATVMDNLVKDYINVAGDVSEVVASGNVIVRVAGVTLKDVTVKGDLIIADGVGEGDVTLENVTVEGRTVVRGGGENSFIVTGNSNLGTIIVAKVDGVVRVFVEGGAEVDVVFVDDGSDEVVVEGKVGTLVVAGEGVTVSTQNATIDKLELSGEGATVSLGEGTSVKEAVVSGGNAGLEVQKGAALDKVEITAPSVKIGGEGEVKSVEVAAGVEGAEVGGKPVEGGQTVDGSGAPATPPASSGGSASTKPQVKTIAMTAKVSGKDFVKDSVLPNNEGVAVTLATATDGAEIYYTLDGTDPTKENGTKYTTGFTIDTNNIFGETITLKAVAVKDGYKDSEVLTQDFVFGAIDKDAYNTSQKKGYDTIEGAIDEAVVNDIIVLIRDIQYSNFVGTALTIAAGKNFTLDLAGRTISGETDHEGGSALITNHGTLVIRDSSANGTGKITYKSSEPSEAHIYATNTITNLGTIIVDSGVIENKTGNLGCSYSIDNNSGSAYVYLTVNGGHIYSENYAIRQFANSQTNENNVEIHGGIVEGNIAARFQLPSGNTSHKQKGKLEISGGTLISTDKDVYNLAVFINSSGSKYDNAEVKLTGGIFDGGFGFSGVDNWDKIEISGGYFNAGMTNWNSGEPKFITGGYFTDEAKTNSENFLAEGYKFVASENQEYPCAVAEYYIAKIGTTRYDTLIDAVDAAANNDTIVLGDNIELDDTLTIDKSITLNLNGHNLTTADATGSAAKTVLKISGASDVIIEGDGLIQSGDTTNCSSSMNDKPSIWATSGISLTIKDGTTIKGGDGVNSYEASPAIWFMSNGTLTIEDAEVAGGDSIKSSVGHESGYQNDGTAGVAIDLMVASNATVNITGSTISGGNGINVDYDTFEQGEGYKQASGANVFDMNQDGNKINIEDSIVKGGDSEFLHGGSAIIVGNGIYTINNSTLTGGVGNTTDNYSNGYAIKIETTGTGSCTVDGEIVTSSVE